MKADLVLHLALPSARAEMTQAALARLRPQLLRHQVAYIGGADLAQAQDSTAIAAAVRAKTPPDCRAVLLSAGALLGGGDIGPGDEKAFRPGAVRAVGELLDALGAGAVTLLVQTRRQDLLMEHAYVRELMAGATHSFGEQFPYLARPALDWGDLLARLEPDPRVVATVLVPVELSAVGVAEFVDHLLGAVGLRGKLDLGRIAATAEPPLYSERGVQVACALAPLLETDAERALVRDFITTTLPAPAGAGGIVLDAGTRAGILAAHADANRRLFRSYLPDLPEDAYAGEDATRLLGAVLPALPARPARPAPVRAPAPLPRRVVRGVRRRLRAARRRVLRRARPLLRRGSG